MAETPTAPEILRRDLLPAIPPQPAPRPETPLYLRLEGWVSTLAPIGTDWHRLAPIGIGRGVFSRAANTCETLCQVRPLKSITLYYTTRIAPALTPNCRRQLTVLWLTMLGDKQGVKRQTPEFPSKQESLNVAAFG